jgi:hypothetical protein
MLVKLRDALIVFFSTLLPKGVVKWLFRCWHGRRFNKLDGEVSDQVLEQLLKAMAWGFRLVPHWRDEIKGFRGTIVFAAKAVSGSNREPVQATAVFDGQRMTVLQKAVESFDAKVTFSNAGALFSFILSRSHDVVDSLLKNAVETKGNINYVYRFGFLVMEMTRWTRGLA